MNDELRKYLEQHAADPTQAGFDFQFLAFLYLALHVGKDESIQYETDDDIVFIKGDNTKELIQVKNAIQTPAGKWQNLTELDEDLWKTIENWLTQKELSKETDFFDSRIFRIYTNKVIRSNEFVSMLDQYRKGVLKLKDIKSYLNDLKAKTKNAGIIKTISNLLKLKAKELHMFCHNFYTEQYSNIIQDIEDFIKFTMKLDKNRVHDVFAGLLMEFKISYYHDTCKRQKTIMSGQELYSKVKLIVTPVFDRELSIDRSVNYNIPSDISKHLFVRQLVDIDYLDEDDDSDIREIYIKKIETINKLSQEQMSYNLNLTALEKINKDALDFWKVEHDCASREINRKRKKGIIVEEDDYCKAGQACLQNIQRKKIEPMDLEMTNGYYYDLSDKPEIGWRCDWEEKYKKNN